MISNAWMRSGHTSALNNYDAFLNETFDVCLKDKKVRLEQIADFTLKSFQSGLKKNINYVVAVKVYENIKYTIGNLTKWIKITKGLDVVSLRFNADSGKEQRYIIVRKQTSEYPKSGGKILCDEPTYRYSAYGTNIELPVD